MALPLFVHFIFFPGQTSKANIIEEADIQVYHFIIVNCQGVCLITVKTRFKRCILSLYDIKYVPYLWYHIVQNMIGSKMKFSASSSAWCTCICCVSHLFLDYIFSKNWDFWLLCIHNLKCEIFIITFYRKQVWQRIFALLMLRSR